jgi:hypothetical protein
VADRLQHSLRDRVWSTTQTGDNMTKKNWPIAAVVLALAVAAPVQASLVDDAAVLWQGKGKDKGQDQARDKSGKAQAQGKDKAPKAQDKGSARGNGADKQKPNVAKHEAKPDKDDRGPKKADRDDKKLREDEDRGSDDNDYRVVRLRDLDEGRRMLPVDFQRLGNSNRTNERFVVNAAAWAVSRGMPVNQVRVSTSGDRVLLYNNNGNLLLDLTDERARTLGAWQMRRLGDRQPTAGSPAYCRSGAGHPVWGRQWCLDKGFGLGSTSNTLWSRADVNDVVFLRAAPAPALDNRSLLSVLGDIVLGRLGLQALSLGYSEPLTGVWVAEPNAPRLLRVQSGGNEVAEFVDLNGDNRVDVLYVSQWR